jgi:hypothetical protein
MERINTIPYQNLFCQLLRERLLLNGQASTLYTLLEILQASL